jgi:integrase
MAVFRCRYTDKRTGKTRKSGNWYFDVKDHSGRVRRIPGFVDKGATEEMRRHVERLVSLRVVKQPPDQQLSAWLETAPQKLAQKLGEWGIIDPRHLPHGKALLDHVKDFRQSIIADGGTEAYADLTAGRVREIIRSCKFTYYSDISASAVHELLAERRRAGRPTDHSVPANQKWRCSRPMSVQTSNFYLSKFKQFCTWMVDDNRAMQSPVGHLDQLNVAVDRRHDRRNLSADELSRLLITAMTGGVNHKMDGTSRALLYRVAMETGFRRNELNSLTPDSIDFENLLITVEAGYTKNREQASQPIRRDLAVELKGFIESRNIAQDEKLWPRMTKQTAKMIKRDLKAARASWLDEVEGAERTKRERADILVYEDSAGRFADFHALRHSYISLITRGGVHPKLAQQLARHSDINLTMTRYSHALMADEAEALGVLPSFPGAFGESPNSRQILAATGTDGAPQVPQKGLQACLQAQASKAVILRHSLSHGAASKNTASACDPQSQKPQETTEKPRLSAVSKSGEDGIRTHGPLAETPVFKTGAIDRSATSPNDFIP